MTVAGRSCAQGQGREMGPSLMVKHDRPWKSAHMLGVVVRVHKCTKRNVRR